MVVLEGKMHLIRIGFVTDFYGSTLTLKSAILELNPRFFLLRVWCRDWLVKGGKKYLIRFDFFTVFCGSNL